MFLKELTKNITQAKGQLRTFLFQPNSLNMDKIMLHKNSVQLTQIIGVLVTST